MKGGSDKNYTELITRLEDTNRRGWNDMDHAATALREAEKKIAELEAENQRLRPYVQHKFRCGAHPDNDHPSGNLPCTCGLDEALRGEGDESA